MNTILEIQHLQKKFKDKTVIKDISLTCHSGKIYGITGYNGCGKSVFFKCVCGIYKPTSGSIEFNGKRLGRDMDMLPNTGMIIEGPAFLGGYSGYTNLDLLYRVNNKRNKEHIMTVMRQVGLNPSLKLPVEKYSLGMKQRLGIAQAIMENPDILILDEPMNGLDKQGVEEIRNLLIQERNHGKMILLASHNPYDIDFLCDEIYAFEDGKLVKHQEAAPAL